MTRMSEADLASILQRRGVPAPEKRVDVSDVPFALPATDDALDPVTIVLAEAPQGKGRPRASLKGGFARLYTPEKTREYEDRIRTAARAAMGNRSPMDAPVEMVLRAVFPIPGSWSNKKTQRAILGEIKPTGKPDLDNICKAFSDALNGIAYTDDALICDVTLRKRYGPQALVVVTVRALP
jgi:Holliday junction resolvase RusA-like endonuclease